MATTAELVARRMLNPKKNSQAKRLAGVPIPVIEEAVRQALATASSWIPNVDGLDEEWHECAGCGGLVPVDAAVHVEDEILCKGCADTDEQAALDTYARNAINAAGVSWYSLTRERKNLLADAIKHALANDAAPADDPFWSEEATRWDRFRDTARALVKKAVDRDG